MRKIFYSIIVVLCSFYFTNDLLAQNGVLTIRVVRVQMLGGDGADNCDDSGLDCGFEHRLDIQTRINGGTYTGPGCQYYSDDNDFNPNLLVTTYSNIAPPVSGDVNLVTYHEDDSAFSNCTYNGSDDNGCAGPVSMTTAINNAVAQNGTPYYAAIQCSPTGVYIELQILWSEIVNGGTTCADIQPICSTNAFSFNLPVGGTAGAGSNAYGVGACPSPYVGNYTNPVTGNYYGCLGARSGPVWWYFKAASAGTITLSLNASSDVDYILYGPFSTLNEITNSCGKLRNHVDCAYSDSPTETIRIQDATIGEYYALLVLNYAGVAQLATLQATAESLDCNVVDACAIKRVSYIDKSACNATNDTYSATVRVEFDLPAGTTFPLNIVVNNQIFSVTSADNTAGFKDVTLLNLPADGLPVSVNAYFQSTPSCAGGLANAWTAPAPCDPCPAKAGNW